MVVGVGLHVQDWIPEWTTIGHVVQETEWQNVGVHTWRSVHGVGTGGRVRDRSIANLLHGFPSIRSAIVVLAEEDGFRLALVEADGCVFPIADVIAESNVEHLVAQIVAVEVEPESISQSPPPRGQS